MSISDIPKELDEWDITKLNNLVKLKDIERETFDFKGTDFNDLSRHLCAFANYSDSGYIVYGIEQKKDTSDPDSLMAFENVGFDDDKKDWIRNQVNNAMVNVEPTPKVDIKNLDENKRTFPVLKIEGEDINRPYFVKGSGKCYIRIGASSNAASRTTILTLFNNMAAKVNDIERLRVTANLLKESLINTSNRIHDIQPNDVTAKIPPINLNFIRNSVLSTEWFFKQNNLYGGHISSDYSVGGVHSFLYDLELLNISIDAYNREYYDYNRDRIKNSIRYWEPGVYKYNETIGFLENIITKSNEFLARVR
jgi:hypothetical protein